LLDRYINIVLFEILLQPTGNSRTGLTGDKAV